MIRLIEDNDRCGGFEDSERVTKRGIGVLIECDPHAPWQKGGIENAIGRMRRRLPRKTDLARLSASQLDALVATYNHTPRKCLGFQTPAEVFCGFLEPLHFKRECTFPPTRKWQRREFSRE